MFTIAHTITLGLAMHNIIQLPASVVEPLIALSIAYVGVENVYAKSLHKSRLVLVFLFGLLHGWVLPVYCLILVCRKGILPKP